MPRRGRRRPGGRARRRRARDGLCRWLRWRRRRGRGGFIELIATEALVVSGRVSADGAGDASLTGGFGAGGGVLLEAPGVKLEATGEVTSLGGGTEESNGGTVKVFTDALTGPEDNVRAGRLLVVEP